MDFNNLLFLYILLPVVILVYFLLVDINRRNWALIIFSLTFYAMGAPIYMVLMVALTFLNYKLAFRIDYEKRRTVLIPVIVNIVILACFKYLVIIPDLLGFPIADTVGFPIGLSVYTFSAISYLVDVYNGKAEPEEKFRNLLLYLMMFPKLLQGPVVRYAQIAPQLEARKHHPRAVFEGIQRFLFGLAKKVLLADGCGRILVEINAMGADNTLMGVWFAAILFMFQIYYDFSGYTDMAIGLGKVFGFRYCENFKRPYMSVSVAQFFEHWNMSLVSFFRDYVYLPLGGDRLGKFRQVLNMFLVCVLAGVWHGFRLNYLLWGVFIFVILAIEKYTASTNDPLPDGICRCITLWLILVGWIIFSHENFADLQAAFAAALGFGGMLVEGLGTWILRSLPLLIVCCIGCTYVPVYIKQIFAGVCGMDRRRMQPNVVTPLRIVYLAVSLGVMILLLWLCTVSMATYPSLQAIYSRF